MEWWDGGDGRSSPAWQQVLDSAEASEHQNQPSSSRGGASLHDLALLAALPEEATSPPRKRKYSTDHQNPVEKSPLSTSIGAAAAAAAAAEVRLPFVATSSLARKQWNEFSVEHSKTQKLIAEKQQELLFAKQALESANFLLATCTEKKQKLASENWQELIEDDHNWFDSYQTFKNSTKDSTSKQTNRWIAMQRKLYRKGFLEEYKIVALNDLNFDWDPATTNWMAKYQLLKEFYTKHGHARVQYDTELGKWVKRQQYQYKLFHQNKSSSARDLTEERIAMLEKIGMIWSRRSESWKLRYQQLLKFYQQHNHVHVTPKLNSSLFEWVRDQRIQVKTYSTNPNESTLDKNQFDLLQTIGLGETDPRDVKFQTRLQELLLFRQTHAHTSVPTKYPLNQTLSNWWATQRRQYALLKRGEKSQLTPERVQVFVDNGLSLESQAHVKMNKTWDELYAEVQEYKLKHNALPLPNTILGKWCQEQQTQHSHISRLQMEQLSRIGLYWGQPLPAQTKEPSCSTWEELFGQLLMHRISTNSFDIDDKTSQLYHFCEQLYVDYANMQKNRSCRYLTVGRLEQLQQINFPFSSLPKTKTWEEMFCKLLQHRLLHGNFTIPEEHNQELHQWYKAQKIAFRKFQKEEAINHDSITTLRMNKLKESGFPLTEEEEEEDVVSVAIQQSPLPAEKPSPSMTTMDASLEEESNLQYGPFFPLDLASITATRSDIAWPSQSSPRFSSTQDASNAF